jgi:glycosyltransferase involved in cell wall biosynthesis
MGQLARRRPVLWVDSIGIRRPRLSRHDVARIWRKAHAPAIRQPQGPGPLVANVRLLPFHDRAGVRLVNRAIWHRAVRHWRRRLELDPAVLVLRLPTAVDLVDSLRPDRVVYLCADDFQTLPSADWQIAEAYELDLLERADVVVVPNARIAALPRIAAARGEVVVLPHGVDFDAFATAGDPAVVHGTFGALRSPVVGYLGQVTTHTDLEILGGIARIPDVTLLVVGETNVPTGDLGRAGDVRLTRSFVPREDVPSFAAACDVLVMPYRPSNGMDLAEPLKLREYLASGRPIVSTRFAAVAPYRNVIRIADDADQFVTEVVDAIRCGPHAGADARRAAVADQTWDRRAEEFEDLIGLR